MNKHFIVSMAIVGLAFASVAQAKSTNPSTINKNSHHISESISSSSSAPAHTGGSTSNVKMGAGFTTLGEAGASLSALMNLNDQMSLQVFAGIPGVNGAFKFDLGGLFRYSVMGNTTQGFHVGGGLDLGTVAGTTSTLAFFINFSPVFGFHFTWPNMQNLLFSVDGGPVLTINDGNVDFAAKPLGGSIIAASVHYMF